MHRPGRLEVAVAGEKRPRRFPAADIELRAAGPRPALTVLESLREEPVLWLVILTSRKTHYMGIFYCFDFDWSTKSRCSSLRYRFELRRAPAPLGGEPAAEPAGPLRGQRVLLLGRPRPSSRCRSPDAAGDSSTSQNQLNQSSDIITLGLAGWGRTHE